MTLERYCLAYLQVCQIGHPLLINVTQRRYGLWVRAPASSPSSIGAPRFGTYHLRLWQTTRLLPLVHTKSLTLTGSSISNDKYINYTDSPNMYGRCGMATANWAKVPPPQPSGEWKRLCGMVWHSSAERNIWRRAHWMPSSHNATHPPPPTTWPHAGGSLSVPFLHCSASCNYDRQLFFLIAVITSTTIGTIKEIFSRRCTPKAVPITIGEIKYSAQPIPPRIVQGANWNPWFKGLPVCNEIFISFSFKF